MVLSWWTECCLKLVDVALQPQLQQETMGQYSARFQGCELQPLLPQVSLKGNQQSFMCLERWLDMSRVHPSSQV
jgi:hypothetical protein